jgi:hypothetical protein
MQKTTDKPLFHRIPDSKENKRIKGDNKHQNLIQEPVANFLFVDVAAPKKKEESQSRRLERDDPSKRARR